MSDSFKRPTRQGTAQGDAKERTMLSATDTGSFRTSIRDNVDGSTTMLRTRGGSPEFTTTDPSSDKYELLPVCAAIPVCTDYPRGFLKGTSGLAPISGEADHGASALISFRGKNENAEPKVLWNELYAEDVHGKKSHPGNRIWYDCRAKEGRTFRGVLSWFCPMSSLISHSTWGDIGSDPKSIWLGEPTMSAGDEEDGSPFSFVPNTQRGVVFRDGEKLHDFGPVFIIAAAIELRYGERLLHAVVADSFSVRFKTAFETAQGNNELGYTSSGYRLLTYSPATDSTVATTLGPEISIIESFIPERNWPIPQFSPDGTKLLRVKGTSATPGAFFFKDDDAFVVVTDILHGGDTEYLYQYNAYEYELQTSPDSGRELYAVLGLWFDEQSRPCALVSCQSIDDGVAAETDVTHYRYGPLQPGTGFAWPSYLPTIQRRAGARGVGYNENWYVGDSKMLVPIAADGFGSFLVGRGIPIIDGLVHENVPSPVLLWADYMTSSGGNGSGYSFGEQVSEASLNVSVLTTSKAGNPVFIEIPNAKMAAHLYEFYREGIGKGFGGGDYAYPTIPSLGSMVTNTQQALFRHRFCFAMNPEKTKFIAGIGTIADKSTHHFTGYTLGGNVALDFDYEHRVYKQSACVIGALNEAGTSAAFTSAETLWGGDYQMLNSPVFFARERRQTKVEK